MNEKTKADEEKQALGETKKANWGEIPEDNFGYASDEERRAKRGLEDWELVEKIPESQQGVPRWFLGIVVVVLLIAIGLSFPFWGDRPGYEREWINWGFGAAILYIAVFGAFVYFMVNFYGSRMAGRLDTDKENDKSGKSDETAVNNSEEKNVDRESTTGPEGQ